jgi:surface antigen
MLDTTGPVSKEVVITTGLFLVILVMGTVTFDLYTRGENTLVLTGATVANSGENTQEQNATTSASNSITGAVIGVSGAVSSSVDDREQQIGVYEIEPSFSVVDDLHVGDTIKGLQRDIRLFHQAVEDCRNEKNKTDNDEIIDGNEKLDDCILTVLNEPGYGYWMPEELCETSEEALFYDVLSTFDQCLASPDTNCLCVEEFLYKDEYDEGEYYFTMLQDEFGTTFTLLDRDIEVTTPIYLAEEGDGFGYDEIMLSVDTTGVLLSTATMALDSHLYLYKMDEETVSIEDQTTFSTYEYTRDMCQSSGVVTKKFCVDSGATVTLYDDVDGAVVDEALVYQFALAFVE